MHLLCLSVSLYFLARQIRFVLRVRDHIRDRDRVLCSVYILSSCSCHALVVSCSCSLLSYYLFPVSCILHSPSPIFISSCSSICIPLCMCLCARSWPMLPAPLPNLTALLCTLLSSIDAMTGSRPSHSCTSQPSPLGLQHPSFCWSLPTYFAIRETLHV